MTEIPGPCKHSITREHLLTVRQLVGVRATSEWPDDVYPVWEPPVVVSADGQPVEKWLFDNLHIHRTENAGKAACVEWDGLSLTAEGENLYASVGARVCGVSLI